MAYNGLVRGINDRLSEGKYHKDIRMDIFSFLVIC